MTAASGSENVSDLQICEAGERLKGWILNNGGVVHPALQVVEVAPSTGARGVVCETMNAMLLEFSITFCARIKSLSGTC